ncbi:dihydroneopterin aldolase [Facklamia miroungae]|uniref:7,8-dihydroneopterin aldolase n=1 Tax=Facklamia miroungae TaxID=120956 RepID=A0A1G7PV65_9LACT|nr:dihydroneopterin aldolase [Facklamia miroungae]NKZ28814.1 dihydroneopterin aldolase [Facklamia miroungae]SDF89270.1 dihydroneopterin aldolase [Facklamia miroungae]
MFKIKLNNMMFYSHIGYFPEEKQLGQKIAIDLTVTMKATVKRDDLNETVSYAHFYDLIQQYIQETRVDLIETVAFDLLQLIKDSNRDLIDHVKVNVRKLQLPIDGILDSAEIELEG